MDSNSRSVTSNQTDIHDDLRAVVEKHWRHQWLAPVAEHDQQAFGHFLAWRQQKGVGRALLLDSGCGTARSSVALAASNPEALVVGLDQSAMRLSKAPKRFDLPENLLLLRAECAGFWRLLYEACIAVSHHQIFYPNPWPKSTHLKRRWHGHPVWPTLLNLGQQQSSTIELRSNWLIYLKEVSAALAMSDVDSDLDALSFTSIDDRHLVTDFEQKYWRSGQALWRLRATLPVQVTV